MSLRMRMLIASMALTAVMGGCDRGWQEFQRIELGKPMPADSLLRLEKAEDPNRVLLVWSDLGVWPVPMSVGWHVVGARLNPEGRVIAKSYRAKLWSSYLLVTVPAMRQVVELQVPPKVLLEPTGEEEDVRFVGTENCQTLRSYIFNAMDEVGLEIACGEQTVAPCLVWLSGANYMTGMLTHGAYCDLRRSVARLPLTGITQEGYDRTFRPVCGGSIRFQNLGQGRIRVEMNLLRLYDPAGLMGYLYMQ